MKIIKAILLASMVAGIATADLAVELINDGGTVTTDGSAFVNNALVQLIWTASVPTAQAGAGGALGAGEYVLYTLITSTGFAGTWSDLNASIGDDGVVISTDADVGGADIGAGYFFVRMFDNLATAINDRYLQQAVTGPALSPYPATVYSTEGLLGGNLATGSQIIPEPAVASLLVVFGSGMLVCRRVFYND